MKRIAVSLRVDAVIDRDEKRDAIDRQMVCLVAAAGGLAFPVPNALWGLGRLEAWLEALQPDGIILSGGNDLGTQPDRDGTEGVLLDWAVQRRLPLLGICRGMQFMAVAGGGRLMTVDGHVRTRHRLCGELDWDVNSYHNYALASCPPDYQILARSEDGSIEGIRHKRLPIEGWMWHPERETPFATQDLRGLGRIFNMR